MPFTKGHKINLGKKYNQERIAKAAEWHKDTKKVQEVKIKIANKLKGRVYSAETLAKMSLAKTGKTPWNKGKPNLERRGANSHLWKGGITPASKLIRYSLEYKLWRSAVFERDNYTCIWCGFKGYVEADHIQPFASNPELRFAIDNGRTLCKGCHKKRHSL